MADITDVTQALVALVAGALYPNGTSQPSAAGIPVKVYEGWPVPRHLDEDLQVGGANVSVYPLPGERTTTRYLNEGESELSISSPKIAAAIAGRVITLSGQIPAADDPHTLVAIINGKTCHYRVLPSDTLASAAAGLAAAINAEAPGATVAGPAITVAPTTRITTVRIAVTGTYQREVRRQTRPVQITVWAPNPQLRTAVSKIIDAALADMPFIDLYDQKARMRYQSSNIIDSGQNDRAWRRDLIYTVDYGTTVAKTATTVAAESISVYPQHPNAAINSLLVNTTNL